MDVTHKCSTATVSKQGVGVNILGGKAAPLSFNLIPAQTETLHLNPKPKVFFFFTAPFFRGNERPRAGRPYPNFRKSKALKFAS